MRYISLFSGIEAASCAWEPLGWEPVAFAEIEPFPKAVLKHHYPNVPDLGDITKVDWRKYRGAVDLVCGGSPCQAFSLAGLRQALDDPRGQLMLEYLRACHEIDPEWVVWENVPGVLSADGGRAFGSFLAAVAELWPDGGAAWRVLDSQFHGVAQRRERVFVVVNTRDWRRAAPVLFERESLCWDYPSSREKRQSLTRGIADGVENADENTGRVTFQYSAGAKAGSVADGEISPTVKTDHPPAAYTLPAGALHVERAGRCGSGRVADVGLQRQHRRVHQIDEIERERVDAAQNDVPGGRSGERRPRIRPLADADGSCGQGRAIRLSGTSNGEDVFPALCASDGSKQFIDNQSVDSGRLLIDGRC